VPSGGAVVAIEDHSQFLRQDVFPLVGDRDEDSVASAVHRDGDSRSWTTVFRCVADEIGDNLLEAKKVD
jgi:hypothetical protein